MIQIILVLMLFIVLNTAFKLSFWKWWQAGIFSLLAAVFTAAMYPLAILQSKTQLADYLQNTVALQNMAILVTLETLLCLAFCMTHLDGMFSPAPPRRLDSKRNNEVESEIGDEVRNQMISEVGKEVESEVKNVASGQVMNEVGSVMNEVGDEVMGKVRGKVRNERKWWAKLLWWYPGLLIFPVLFYCLTELIFTFAGVQFTVTAYCLAAAVLILLPLLAQLMKYLVPEPELRLEFHFLISLFICLLGLLSTVNGRMVYAAVSNPVSLGSLAIALGIFAILLIVGYIWNSLKFPYLQRRRKQKGKDL